MSDKDVVHAPKNHFSDAFSALADLYKQKCLCDVILKTENVEFHAHKVVLSACCRYFAAMFRSGMTETHQNEIELRDVNAVALECILTLFYTGQLTLHNDNVQCLFSAANFLQIDHLREACSNFLRHHLSPSNCLGIKMFAEVHGCQYLVEAAQRHTLARFPEVSCEKEFLTLSIEEVMILTGSNNLNSMLIFRRRGV